MELAGHVDKCIQRAELTDRAFDECIRMLGFTQICGEHSTAYTALPHLFGHRFHPFSAAEIA